MSFSAYARNLPVGDFNSHVHGDQWLGKQAVKRAYPEIDIYAHAKTIAQSGASEDVQYRSQSEQNVPGTRGFLTKPVNL
jgi:hypothetical protein